jgi:hypothetical protein
MHPVEVQATVEEHPVAEMPAQSRQSKRRSMAKRSAARLRVLEIQQSATLKR